MTAITDQPTPRLTRRSPVHLTSAAPTLWRVVDADGRIVGHLQAVSAKGEVRYRARRFHSLDRAFRDLGDFWCVDDAIDCLRFAQ